MVRWGRMLLAVVAASTVGCGRTAPVGTSPAVPLSPRMSAIMDPLAFAEVSHAVLADHNAGLQVLDASQNAMSAQYKALEDQIKKLDSQHQAALSALVWQDIKGKTQLQLLLQARQWQQHPDLQVSYLQGLLNQVQGMPGQRAVQVAQTLPPGALDAASASGTASAVNAKDQIPASLKPAYDALSKRVDALSVDRAKALIGQMWADTKDLTTQQLWDQQQNWKAHPEQQLAYLTREVATVEKANDSTIKALISDTPPEVIQAAQEAAKAANQGK